MSVRKSLAPRSPLRTEVQAGKQALRKSDREKIAESAGAKVVDSLDLDAATARELPEENRWDYLVGTTVAGATLLAIEVHPASTSQVSTVIQKKLAAELYLKEQLVSGARPKAWIWLASGTTAIPQTTAQDRRLNQAGIRLAGGRLNLREIA